MNEISKQISEAARAAGGAVTELQGAIEKTEQSLNKTIDPIRKSFLHKFPTLFLLVVTFGVSATFFGIEQVLIQSELLTNYPWLILTLGIFTLILTGTLYKKLG